MPIQARKFAIIGGAGFLGSAVAHTLLRDASTEAIICDSFGEVSAQKWAALPANISDIWTPDTLLTNLDKSWREIAGVIVLADGGHESQDFDAILEAAFHLPRRIWDFCVAKQRPIYWASSAHVYGDGPSDLSAKPDDVAALNPTTPFGRAKLAFDVFAARQGTGPNAPPVATGFRLASLYGAGERHKGEFASLPVRALDHARAGTSLKLWDKSDTICRDWTHVDDAARAMSGLILNEHTGFFDIGTGKLTSTIDLVQIVEAVTSTKLALEWISHPPHGVPSHPVAKIGALEAAGVSVQFRSLHEGLAQL
jgi:nucleoside-diphosphate-sugar epimerase